MLLTHEELRAAVAAVAKDVAGAYARFEPAFLDSEVAGRFARLPGVHPAVAERLAAAHCTMSNDFGDGEKAAVLVACEIVRAAQERLPGEGRTALAPAIDRVAGRAAERVASFARPVRSPAELLRAATPAAGGDAAIGKALVEAFLKTGRDGIIQVERGENGRAGVTVVDVGDVDGAGWIEKVVVCGRSEAETQALYLRACCALHAARAAIAEGVVPGGGVAYVLAGGSADEGDDTITELAVRAVNAGLEAPLRVRAEAAGSKAKANAILAAVRNKPDSAFEQTKPGLVPVADGPLDAARVVREAIREAGRAACDLLRRAL